MTTSSSPDEQTIPREYIRQADKLGHYRGQMTFLAICRLEREYAAVQGTDQPRIGSHAGGIIGPPEIGRVVKGMLHDCEWDKSNVYNFLRRLVDLGYIEAVDCSHAHNHCYRITEQGHDALDEHGWREKERRLPEEDHAERLAEMGLEEFFK